MGFRQWFRVVRRHPEGAPVGTGPTADGRGPTAEANPACPPPPRPEPVIAELESERDGPGPREEAPRPEGQNEAEPDAAPPPEAALPEAATPEAAPSGAHLAVGQQADRPPGVDLATAEAVLAVADVLSSPELRRRLSAAVALLPDVEVIVPGEGERFSPDRHEWVESRPAPASEDAETIAEVLHAGLADHSGRVRRRARVVVYDDQPGGAADSGEDTPGNGGTPSDGEDTGRGSR